MTLRILFVVLWAAALTAPLCLEPPPPPDTRVLPGLPTFGHPLGSDQFGRDFATRLLFAIGPSAALAASGTAVVLAAALAWAVAEGGWDRPRLGCLLATLAGGLMAVPDLAVLAALHGHRPHDLNDSTRAAAMAINVALLATLAAQAVPPLARVLAVRVREVAASSSARRTRFYNVRGLNLLTREFLPQLAPDLGWATATAFPRFLHAEAALSVLGLGFLDVDGLGELLRDGLARVGAAWGPTSAAAAVQVCGVSAAMVGLALSPRLWSARPLPVAPSAAPTDELAPLPDYTGAAVGIRGLTVTAPGGAPILTDVSLALVPGVNVLCGPSGSGKTTLATVLLGNLAPGWSVRVDEMWLLRDDGRLDLASMPPAERRRLAGRLVARVPQAAQSSLDPRYAPLELSRLALRAHAPDITDAEADRRATEAFRAAQLPARCWRLKAGKLSGGECQRVLIGLAHLHRPALVVYDEPTTALDPATRDGVLALIRAQGSTALVITHDPDVAAIADVTHWLEGGRVGVKPQGDPV